MNCEEVIRELSNFLDGELEPGIKLDFEQHLAGCGECLLIVNQTKTTIEIFADNKPVELPSEVRTRLHEALRRKFKETKH